MPARNLKIQLRLLNHQLDMGNERHKKFLEGKTGTITFHAVWWSKLVKNLISTLQAPFIYLTETSFSQKKICSKILCCSCQFTKCKCMCCNVIRSSILRVLYRQCRICLQLFYVKEQGEKYIKQYKNSILCNKIQRNMDYIIMQKIHTNIIESFETERDSQKTKHVEARI